MNRGFTRKSPKVNSSRAYGCFKIIRIQQKHFQANDRLFFRKKTGHVAIVPLEQRRTVTSEWYTNICLPVVFQELRKTNRRRRITLQHDNASSHTLAQTTAFLSTQKIDLMSHPPYCPDLAPNDFFLFPYVKSKMRGQRFSTSEEAIKALRMHVLEIPQSEWQKCFDNWFERMQKCMILMGNILKYNKAIYDN